MSRPALFLDRDGTLVEPLRYPTRPEQLRLHRNLGPELRKLQSMGFLLIVVTNQSGVARGYLSESKLELMHDHLREELQRGGVQLDAIYHCSHHPEGIIPELSIRCDCRKPEPGMLLRAAADFGIDLACSWLVGDTLDDIEAGLRAGCRTVLVDLGTQRIESIWRARPEFICSSTREALQTIAWIESAAPSAQTRSRASSGSVDPGASA